MKKVSFFVVSFLFVLFFSNIVQAAHVYNPTSKPSLYVTQNYISLVNVKADRDMGTLENEDRFWISFLPSETITEVKITCRALDGVNDADTREWTFRYDSLTVRSLKTLYMDDLPTHVDNMYIHVEYTYNEIFYENNFYVFSVTNIDKGTGIFSVSTQSIPEKYKDTNDGEGTWDSSKGVGVVGSGLLKFVKVPYNFIKWYTSIDTTISFAMAGILIGVPFYLTTVAPKMAIYFVIPILMGVISLGAVIWNGYQQIIS